MKDKSPLLVKGDPSYGDKGSNPAASLECVEVLPGLVHPLDFYPLLIFHMGTCNAAESNLECIKNGYNLRGE